MLQLCGAVIEWNTEKSSRKNVFQVNTYLMAYSLWLFKIDGTEIKCFGGFLPVLDYNKHRK